MDNFTQQLAELLKKDSNNKESGFFDLPKQQGCTSKNHLPPTHIHIPYGKGYKHVCPDCKEETIIIPPQISF